MLAEEAAKHYFSKTEQHCKEQELDISHALCKELQRLLVNQGKEQLTMAREWDELMALLLTDPHVDMELLTADNIVKEQVEPIESKKSSGKAKDRQPMILQRGEGSKRQQRSHNRLKAVTQLRKRRNMNQMSRDLIMKRIKPHKLQQHLEVRQQTAPPKQAALNRTEHRQHLQIPKQGKLQE